MDSSSPLTSKFIAAWPPTPGLVRIAILLRPTETRQKQVVLQDATQQITAEFREFAIRYCRDGMERIVGVEFPLFSKQESELSWRCLILHLKPRSEWWCWLRSKEGRNQELAHYYETQLKIPVEAFFRERTFPSLKTTLLLRMLENPLFAFAVGATYNTDRHAHLLEMLQESKEKMKRHQEMEARKWILKFDE